VTLEVRWLRADNQSSIKRVDSHIKDEILVVVFKRSDKSIQQFYFQLKKNNQK